MVVAGPAQPRPTGLSIGVVVCHRRGRTGLDRAVRSVRDQTRSADEIVLVADEAEIALPELGLPTRVVVTDRPGPGAARQAGLSALSTDLVAYCDDDDYWDPQHLEVLAGHLEDHTEIDLVYGDSIWVQGPGPGDVAYSCDFDRTLLGYSNYVLATDVVHRRQLALDAGGFDSTLMAHEDWDLWLRMSMDCRLWHLPLALATRTWSPDCVSAGETWADWMRVFQSHCRRLETGDDVTRHDLVPTTTPSAAAFDGSTWNGDGRHLLWCSLLRPNEGFGSVGAQLMEAVIDRGVTVWLPPTVNQLNPGRAKIGLPPGPALGFYYHYKMRPGVLGASRLVTYSMWESTAVPEDHVEQINRTARLHYVPCRQNVESFTDRGVTVPIRVLHHGVDPERFPFVDRPVRDQVVFGTFGDLSPRKGVDVLIRAFEEEFSPSEPARLVLKSGHWDGDLPRHPGVVLVTGFLDQAGLVELLGRVDVFVLPSRGEGFGLCGLEAMATGLPLIATDWSGPAEYLDPADSYPLGYELVDAAGTWSNNTTYNGCWAEPDVDDLRRLMRHAFEHPAETRQRGEQAAERVRRDWSWDRIADQLVADLDDLASLDRG